MTDNKPAACIIGYPVRHSRSPMLHGYWLQRYGIDASYRAEEISPENIKNFITNLAAHGYVGANVTMPHKEIAFALSKPDERAAAVGASNTLWFEDGELLSTNTDVEGFVYSLDAASPEWDQQTNEAIVLGAGGAGRAVIYGLVERGIAKIHVVNRTVEKSRAMREEFGPTIHPTGWADLPDLLRRAHLLVNSTSLGMHDQPPLDIDVNLLPDGAVVADIVYVPLTTPLLAAAKARGLATANGLDMLLHQAVRGFELWFGKRPEVTREQYDLLAADIVSD